MRDASAAVGERVGEVIGPQVVEARMPDVTCTVRNMLGGGGREIAERMGGGSTQLKTVFDSVKRPAHETEGKKKTGSRNAPFCIHLCVIKAIIPCRSTGESNAPWISL